MAGLRQLSGFPMITKGIYLVIGMFAFVLGIISFYDYLQFRRGHMEKMKLQLPMVLEEKDPWNYQKTDPLFRKRAS